MPVPSTPDYSQPQHLRGKCRSPFSTFSRLGERGDADFLAAISCPRGDAPRSPSQVECSDLSRDRIDILVNTAGITQPLKIMHIVAENDDAVLDVNLRGTL
ncbi:hypothetical protein [Roseitranquillus sediminis]|uniref:hypothetical protein n=1 Tax=Roseitranquillus sediminis TaxID=2809051 RepID=UPI001D0CB7AF|nr:hypothetical protein [Roseitranquillus sediminis]